MTGKIDNELHDRNQSLNVQNDDDNFNCPLSLDFLDGNDFYPLEKCGSKS
tara:strand:+ start:294 stop:443 length:150 start_codon:yes stop_codon:yes gene_type:complete